LQPILVDDAGQGSGSLGAGILDNGLKWKVSSVMDFSEPDELS
jgi:hypothetical protein